MNRNMPRHHHRESKHSTGVAASSARCNIPQRRPYSSSLAIDVCERQQQLHGEDSLKSQSIPICEAALRRTASELKLCEDEATADNLDYIFFSRLLTGITRQQQQKFVSESFLRESDECLAHIIGTRNGSLDNLQKVSSASEYLARSDRYQAEKDEDIFPMDI